MITITHYREWILNHAILRTDTVTIYMYCGTQDNINDTRLMDNFLKLT